MVYVKSEKTKAGLAAKRALIVASAIDVISAYGADQLTSAAVTDRAGISRGLLFTYFADMTELRVAVTMHLLDSDLAAIREAKAASADPLHVFAAALAAFYYRLGRPTLSQFRLCSPSHLDEVRTAFVTLIRAALPDTLPKASREAAGAALGALYGFHGLRGQSRADASGAVLFILRGLGVSEARANRAILEAT